MSTLFWVAILLSSIGLFFAHIRFPFENKLQHNFWVVILGMYIVANGAALAAHLFL